jgi:anti-anti-sigma regulatory factor
MAKQLALLVFRSHRLGFTTFLFDLNQVPLMDEKASQHLARIGQGLRNKGGSWRVLGNPSSLENRLLFGTNLEQLPKETWN